MCTKFMVNYKNIQWKKKNTLFSEYSTWYSAAFAYRMWYSCSTDATSVVLDLADRAHVPLSRNVAKDLSPDFFQKSIS